MTPVAGVLLALLGGAGLPAGAQVDQREVARLSQAAREGRVEDVVSGARGLPPEALDSLGQAAACAARQDVLRALVELGARPKAFGAGALRCLYRAGPAKPNPLAGLPEATAEKVGEMTTVQVVRLLLEAGADLNARFEQGATILQAAVATCRPALVAPLLEAEIDVDAADAAGRTALMVAARCPADLVTMLLTKGASAEPQDRKGHTAIDMLAMANLGAAAYRARLASLMPHGGRQGVLDGSALGFAAASGNLDAVKELLTAGANPNGSNQQGETPLHRLAENCWGPMCEAIIAVLVEAGADPAVKSLAGRVPYEIARDHDRAPLVGHLLAQWKWSALEGLGARAASSDTLVEKGHGADFYSPQRALDGRADTCWCVRVPGIPTMRELQVDPAGTLEASHPWIAVRFARPSSVLALRIYPGCSDSPAIFRANNQVTRLRVEIGKRTQSVDLSGGMRFHDLGIATGEPVDSVRFEIEAISRGSKYDDTCIAEIQAALE